MGDELDFLRYFYYRARWSMGPSDDDIYEAIKFDYFTKTGFLPEGYGLENDQDDEDESCES